MKAPPSRERLCAAPLRVTSMLTQTGLLTPAPPSESFSKANYPCPQIPTGAHFCSWLSLVNCLRGSRCY
jgi:hypothetical protein